MLPFQIDPHSSIPAYRQIVDQVKYFLASGLLFPDCIMPSIREMSKALSLSTMTIVKAYKHLEAEGILIPRQGAGVFVTQTARGPSEEERRESLRRIARQLMIEAAQMNAPEIEVMQIVDQERLALNPDSELMVRLGSIRREK